MTDSKWWNTYLALPRGGNRPWGMADGESFAAGRGVEAEDEIEEDSATLTNLDTEDELALEEFWVGRYFMMTGHDGSWVYEGYGFLSRAGFALLVLGSWVWGALLLVLKVPRIVGTFLIDTFPVIALGAILYCIIRFIIWIST